MRVPAALAVAIACLSCAISACGGSDEAPPRSPDPAPEIALTPAEEEVWAPLPPNRREIPVLLYHGIGPESAGSTERDSRPPSSDPGRGESLRYSRRVSDERETWPRSDTLRSPGGGV